MHAYIHVHVIYMNDYQSIVPPYHPLANIIKSCISNMN